MYETNLNGLLVLWCIRIHETAWTTNYEFMILEGKNDSGNLFRSWNMPKKRHESVFVSDVWPTFTIFDAMQRFAFKRIA